MRRCSGLLCLYLAVGLGCQASPVVRPAPRTALDAPSGETSAQRTAQPAKLVVVVILDQMGSWALERYWPYLSDDGLLHQAAKRGYYQHKVTYGYAATFTAPGHAAIETGLPPAYSGIGENLVWSAALGKPIHVSDDREHAYLTNPQAFAAPTRLRASTVGDALKQQTRGRGKVVSLSLKDYAAVVSGGHHPDLCLWFEDDGQIPGFTTSTYYAPHFPAWLTGWKRENPLIRRLTVWKAEDPALYKAVNGADDTAGEENMHGFGMRFPHDPRASLRPLASFLMTPQSNDYLIDLAQETVRALDLGRDDIPDLLSLSLSATDRVGHHFGIESWEYFDTLRHTDRSLGRFVSALEKSVGPIAVVVTSDHGSMPLVERTLKEGRKSGRLDPDALKDKLEHELEEAFGAKKWIDSYNWPMLYLTSEAQSLQWRTKVIRLILQRLSQMTEVAAAYDVEEAVRWKESADEMKRLVALSIPPAERGDVYIVPAPFYAIWSLAAGTTHGSPWPYDRQVPVLYFGPNVTQGEGYEVLDQSRVSATIAALLGVTPLSRPDATPLPGVLGR